MALILAPYPCNHKLQQNDEIWKWNEVSYMNSSIVQINNTQPHFEELFFKNSDHVAPISNY